MVKCFVAGLGKYYIYIASAVASLESSTYYFQPKTLVIANNIHLKT